MENIAGRTDWRVKFISVLIILIGKILLYFHHVSTKAIIDEWYTVNLTTQSF